MCSFGYLQRIPRLRKWHEWAGDLGLKYSNAGANKAYFSQRKY